MVSGHRSWQSLKRYTHIRERGDKYADWARKNPALGRVKGGPKEKKRLMAAV